MSAPEKHQLAVLNALARVAISDGQVSHHEEALYYALADRMNCSKSQATAIWNQEEVHELSPPASEWDRIGYLHMSVLMMAVDGSFGAREQKVVNYLGAKLALRPEVLKAIIQLFGKHYPAPVPESALLSAYQIPHN